ncbi:MAG: hypothetical protein ABIQ09_13010 [Jatrophihabitantaceae bacterium]
MSDTDLEQSTATGFDVRRDDVRRDDVRRDDVRRDDVRRDDVRRDDVRRDDVRRDDVRRDDARHDGPVPDDVDNPWHGIPRELLGADRSYDPDTAGGCG